MRARILPSRSPFATLVNSRLPSISATRLHRLLPLGCCLALQSDKVEKYMTKFKRTAGTPYTIITPSTPLAELKQFLDRNIFAIVTDWDRKFVLGVVTSQDFEVRSALFPQSFSPTCVFAAIDMPC